MFSSFLVTFREILEIALIVGVVLAATEGATNRKHWIGLGFGIGIAGSLLVAFFTEAIANVAEGMGQELFNALILLTASFIIGWTAIWMRSHARHIITGIREKGKKIVEGELPRYTLTVIIALTVLREGAEIVLFTYSMLASGQPPLPIALGSLGGVLSGTLLGYFLYKGLVSIPTKYIFQVTTWMLLLLAAGMSSMAARFLVAAGYFENYAHIVWNTSHILPENSMIGQIMHVLVGYTEQPMQVQLITYVLTLGIFCSMLYLIPRTPSQKA